MSAAALVPPPARLDPTRLPRMLAGPRGERASLDVHLDTFGLLDVDRARDGFVDAVEQSGLLGRGGGGFPTAVKMRAVAGARGPRVVVVNGSEGEPLSHKDALLLARRPHLVIDGAELAAGTVGADEVIFAVDRAHTSARAGVEQALDEVPRRSRSRPSLRVVDVPSRYLAGEESALVHYLNGGDAKPTFVPPRPYERGVRGRPTLVQNVETVAQLALIGRYGPDWFRAVGAPEEPGTVLLTIDGVVAKPGVLEAPTGATLASIVEAAGGLTEEVAAFLIGGYFGTWFPAEAAWQLPLSQHGLRRAGGGLGCGVVYAFPRAACGVTETARIAAWLAAETAGQCGPCVHGLAALAGELQSLAAARHAARSVERVSRWAPQIIGRGACRYPDGATRFVTTALEAFAADVELHAAGRVCAHSGAPPLLPVREPRERGWR